MEERISVRMPFSDFLWYHAFLVVVLDLEYIPLISMTRTERGQKKLPPVTIRM